MPWRKCCTAPRPSAGGCTRRRKSRPEDRFPPLQFQLLLEQRKTKILESQSLDVSLWKLMISLLQTRLTGDRAPLLKNLTALINELTGQGLTGLARSGGKATR